MSELTYKRMLGLFSGLAMLGIGFLVKTFPDFFLEWGSMNTLKGLMGWSWVMVIGGALVAVICGLLLIIDRR